MSGSRTPLTLTFMGGAQDGRTVVLEQGVGWLGRRYEAMEKAGAGPDNAVIIDEVHVSGVHALVESDDGQIYVTDLGSRNRTTVGKSLIAPKERVPLPPGTLFKVGYWWLKAETR